ncbi:crotonase/enoyl-CoA hydratase family protein [Cupriavidus sp. H39]|uniref:crotonase/enoyl-CoA hydratase family protein n=1 Tax=Cupriavidus sp. H39 TaxID=3401635 RepID=UPI003D00EC83
MTTEQAAVLEKQDGVAVITLNRPEVKNCCNNAMAIALQDIMDEIEEDRTCFVAVIHGAGGNFSTGADLKEAASGAKRARLRRGGFGCFMHPLRKPLIAAVEGYAVGGGFELCLTADMVVAAANAKFGLPEVRHNLVAVGGGLFRLPKKIPCNIAFEMALTGKFYDADFLRPYGLLNRVVEPGAALDSAIELARSLLVNGPTALAASKRIMSKAFEWQELDAWENQMPIAQVALNSRDRVEGLKAFAAKRAPVWSGE